MAASIISPSTVLKGMMQMSGIRQVVRSIHNQSKLLYSQSATHSSPEVINTTDGNAPASPAVHQVQDIDVESRLQESLHHEDYFQLKNLVTLKDLFKARVHLGHNSGLRHETMSPFIFGQRLGRDIIDLEHTLPRLFEALNVCAHIVYRGGMVLFLCRNAQVTPWVEKMAKEVNEYAHCRPWKSGIFTNAGPTFNTLPIYPDLCVFFNTQDTVFEQHKAVAESSKLLIPSVGFVDTNCTVNNVTYPIPANDDTPQSMHLYISLFHTAVMKAKEKRTADGLFCE